MKSHFLLLFLLIFAISKAAGNTEAFNVCPLCTNEGVLTCPGGYVAACADETPGDTEPKCIFYGKKHIPGCWKFAGIKKIDFSLLQASMPPTTMIEITGGGEVYTLNREIIGCRKL